MRYDLLHPKALRKAVIEHLGPDVDVPQERQFRRWVSGDTPIPSWARRVIDEIVAAPQQQEAPRPEWAEGLMLEADAAYRLLKLTALASGVSPELVEEIEAGRRDALEQSPSGRLPSAPRRRASPGPRDG